MFEPSTFSRHNPDYVEVRDSQGTGPFRVNSDGSISLGATTWTPGAGSYAQVLANLRDVPGNASKIDSVLGSGSGSGSVSMYTAPASQTQVSKQAVSRSTASSEPSGGFSWFWPVTLVSAAVVVGGVGYYLYATSHGQQMVRSAQPVAARTAVKAKELSVRGAEEGKRQLALLKASGRAGWSEYQRRSKQR